jgi:hypothetical protein
MGGRGGKNRIAIVLDQADKPALVMSDERLERRNHVGFMDPDTFPFGDWDHCGLSFRAFGSERLVAGMGMVNIPGGRMDGFLTVSGKSIR